MRFCNFVTNKRYTVYGRTKEFLLIFTARCYALDSAVMPQVVCPSVYLSSCLSVCL